MDDQRPVYACTHLYIMIMQSSRDFVLKSVQNQRYKTNICKVGFHYGQLNIQSDSLSLPRPALTHSSTHKKASAFVYLILFWR